MSNLNVFVSSTCYDLSQVRNDLYDFIKSSGHNPFLSEFNDFPINPGENTIDNCISAVNNNADIFVLIVGNRYGSLVDSGKSITNEEFLAATSKGIPIYVFIDKRILSILPVWKANRSGNFSDIVDSTKIFEFVSDIRDDSQRWTFEFNTAQDIISVLKIQMSILFKESLIVKNKIEKNINELFELGLSSEAIRILINKNETYEIEFFTQVLLDEIRKKETIMNHYRYKIFTEPRIAIFNGVELSTWLQNRLGDLNNMMKSINSLFNLAYPKFWGEPGTPADLKGIYYISETYARIFESIISWHIATASTIVDDKFIVLRDSFAKLANKLINRMWEFPFEQKDTLDKSLIKVANSNETITIKSYLKLELDEVDLKNYEIEFERIRSRLLGD